MSLFQSIEPVAETRHDRDEIAQQHRLTVGEALNLPALCGPQDIARLWDISPSQVCRLAKRGEFDFLKVKPAVGPKQFSGVLIGRYLSGEPIYLPSFGRKRG